MSNLPCVICSKKHDHRSGDHICVGNLQDLVEAKDAEIERLREENIVAMSLELPKRYAEAQAEIERLRADGIHSCGPKCDCLLAQANRRIAKLEAVVAREALAALEDDDD